MEPECVKAFQQLSASLGVFRALKLLCWHQKLKQFKQLSANFCPKVFTTALRLVVSSNAWATPPAIKNWENRRQDTIVYLHQHGGKRQTATISNWKFKRTSMGASGIPSTKSITTMKLFQKVGWQQLFSSSTYKRNSQLKLNNKMEQQNMDLMEGFLVQESTKAET